MRHSSTADHPFVFFIIDNRFKAIIFIGRYIKPTHGEKLRITAWPIIWRKDEMSSG
ncbi:MAG: hypothetical protein JJE08_01255 [Proteiniphilum sp.]|nr:hypothetical protein [Proteiniphilum sp.]